VLRNTHKWVLLQKPALREKYVQGFIDKDWIEINNEMEASWNNFTQNAIILYT